MNSKEIRNAFLDYFASKDHTVIDSSSLVPANDPTLLFTNAGMVQFKDVFLGKDQRDYNRSVTAQRCVRAGGKHNDLENVGYTARHHTFFEMMGNFSFGDYFKRDAIFYAWEFLTQVLKLPAEKLWVTVHISDDEAADIWLQEVGVDANRFSRLDEDNFWQMGDTGPCGPCSEIFYDHGEDIPGGPPGSENDDLDRYIEIWNLVFMQYERQSDGSLQSLSMPSVDTGMGLERIAAVMQGVHNNYDIDIFKHLLQAAAEATGIDEHDGGTADQKSYRDNKSLCVIADHIRSCAFLVADGVLPANIGRGSVLRRIIRRAIRHGHKLGCRRAFFHTLVGALVEVMGDAYPILKQQQTTIEHVLLKEEQQFEKTLDRGLTLLNDVLEGLSASPDRMIPGEVIFTLYDTYGFPPDLTNDIARERDFKLDMQDYQRCMAEQRARARESGKFTVDYSNNITIDSKTAFSGYQSLTGKSEVVALFKDNQPVDQLNTGDQGIVVLTETPFYAESGGQVGDTGFLQAGDNHFEVFDCQKLGDSYLHIGQVSDGAISANDEVEAMVDNNLRTAIALNHSATHLLHATLRDVLGEHVTQQGSLVDAEKLRFDFSHNEAVTAKQLKQIERRINQEIRRNTAVKTELCDMETAKTKGAMALFGEKYGSEVRVLTMGDGYSVELCGGTHVKRTGDIGLFRITSETGIAAGIRRIEAVTGECALALFDQSDTLIAEASQMLKASSDKLIDKLEQLTTQVKEQQKQLASLQAKMATASTADLITNAEEINNIKFIAHKIDSADGKTMMTIADSLKSRLNDGVFLLAAIDDGKVSLVAGVSKTLTDRFKAGDLIKAIAPLVDGKGGGRADMARGGGPNVSGVEKAISAAKQWITQQSVS